MYQVGIAREVSTTAHRRPSSWARRARPLMAGEGEADGEKMIGAFSCWAGAGACQGFKSTSLARRGGMTSIIPARRR